MKISKCINAFSLAAVVVAMCAFQSKADTPNLIQARIGGNSGTVIQLSVTPGVANDVNNPNKFSVAFVETVSGIYGFLLDGSDMAKIWFDEIEFARVNNRAITLSWDDNTNNSVKVPVSIFGAISVGRIWYIQSTSMF